MRAAVAEARQLGGVRVAQHAAQGLGAAPADATVWVGLEEAVDTEAGAERARRREAEEGREPGDEVGKDAVGEEQRDEDPLQQRVREHPRDAVALLAQRRREVGAGHGRLRHHPRSPVPRQPAECDGEGRRRPRSRALPWNPRKHKTVPSAPESLPQRHRLDCRRTESAIQERFFGGKQPLQELRFQIKEERKRGNENSAQTPP